MELSALNVFITTTTLFVVVMLLMSYERKRQRRFLGGVRSWLDMRVVEIERQQASLWRHFARYVLQLGWYYSLHSLLQAVLKVLVTLYESVERIFESNRHKAKQLRAEKKGVADNHLTKMAEHKIETTLTEDQQEKLRETKLEERH